MTAASVWLLLSSVIGGVDVGAHWKDSDEILSAAGAAGSLNKTAATVGKIAVGKKCNQGYHKFGCCMCTKCNAGKYMDQNGHKSGTCKKCPNGRYAETKGTSACKTCPPARYGSGAVGENEILQACDWCHAKGQYTDVAGLTACKLCPAGKGKIAHSTGVCTNCENGLYSDINGGDCKYCPGGYATDHHLEHGGTKADCKICQPGFHSIRNTNGGAYQPCAGCEPGMYEDEIGVGNDAAWLGGGAACKLCPEDKWAGHTGHGSCKDCPAGKYQNHVGKSKCKTCYSTTNYHACN